MPRPASPASPPTCSFFDQISQDTGKFVFGVKDTLACLEMGAVETLIVWENLDMQRYEFTNTTSGERERAAGAAGFCMSCVELDTWQCARDA